MHRHAYRTHVSWEGGPEGTAAYDAYERNYRIVIDHKPDLHGSADPVFRGDASRHNPEELFVAAISACHMLTYLALCARHGIRVVRYEDAAAGTMETSASGGGRFVEVTLRPAVTIVHGDPAVAGALHDRAHESCFIANSCRVPIRHEPAIQVAVE